MRVTRLAVAVAALTAAGSLAACGTRLPASRFSAANGNGEVVSTESGGPESIGPSQSASAGRSVTTGGQGGTGPGGGGGQNGTGAVGNVAGNTASDTGVTTSTLKLGIIVSKTNVLGTNAFSQGLYGAQAYVNAWNARGGQHGRRVQLVTCDDQSSPNGNAQCVDSLISQGVFAFVGNTIFSYGAAAKVSAAGVPDIGGQPIDNAYDTYAHLYDIYGEAYPRNGQPGQGGKLYGGNEDFLWFRDHVGVKTAGVVYYNQADAERFAKNIENQLSHSGYKVVDEPVNFGFPNYAAAVQSMKSQGVDAVWDALDGGGDNSLCKAMDNASWTVKAKVQNVQTWRQDVASYSPTCRRSVYVTGKTLAYSDTANPVVAQFRQDLQTYAPQAVPTLAEWTFEGWAAVQWLDDAVGTCAASPTRKCVESYLQKPGFYTGHGILTPRNFTQVNFVEGQTTVHSCVSAAKWDDGAGTFVQVSDITKDCYDAKQYSYPAS